MSVDLDGAVSFSPVKVPHGVLSTTIAIERDPLPFRNGLLANRDLLNLEASFAQISGLDSDWDGYGAERIIPTIVANAKTFAQRLITMGAPAPDVTPTPDGTIELEWHLPRGRAYLEIGASTFSFVMRMNDGGKAISAGRFDSGGDYAVAFVCAQICQAEPKINSSTSINWIFQAHVM